MRPIQDFPLERFSPILRLMLEAPFLLIRAALPAMYERGFGRIINVSSRARAACVALQVGLRRGQARPRGPLEGDRARGRPSTGSPSNCVNPGYVRTPLVEKQIADQARVHGIPEEEVLAQVMLTEYAIKRLVEPAEVAELVAWLAADAGPSSPARPTRWTAAVDGPLEPAPAARAARRTARARRWESTT